jgi:hypothetical protein
MKKFCDPSIFSKPPFGFLTSQSHSLPQNPNFDYYIILNVHIYIYVYVVYRSPSLGLSHFSVSAVKPNFPGMPPASCFITPHTTLNLSHPSSASSRRQAAAIAKLLPPTNTLSPPNFLAPLMSIASTMHDPNETDNKIAKGEYPTSM